MRTKLLSAASGFALLVSFSAQAAEVMTDKQMDTVAAGANMLTASNALTVENWGAVTYSQSASLTDTSARASGYLAATGVPGLLLSTSNTSRASVIPES